MTIYHLKIVLTLLFSLMLFSSPLSSASTNQDSYEVDDTSATAKTIVLEEIQAHNFHVDSDVDWMKYTLVDYTDVVVEAVGTRGENIRVQLHDSALSIVRSDNENLGGYSKSSFAALAPGTYYIKASKASGSVDAIGGFSYGPTNYHLSLRRLTTANALSGDYANRFASTLSPLPFIASPLSGSTFTGSSELFLLDNDGVTTSNWALWIGSTIGAFDIAVKSAGGSSGSIVVHNLPTDNRPIFVRLLYKENEIWKIAGDYNYVAAPEPPILPFVLSPYPGSTLTTGRNYFLLDRNGLAISNWSLQFGTSVGGHDIGVRGGSDLFDNLWISNLPTDGSIIYLRFLYFENFFWKLAGDFTYTAPYIPPPQPTIASPLSGSTLTGSSEFFLLDNDGATISNWVLWVGSTPGAFDIGVRSASGSSSGITVHNLPTDGSPVFVRLLYKENEIWKIAGDYNYLATPVPPTLPFISSPVSGSTLTGDSQTFELDDNGITFTHWSLSVGTSVGASDISLRVAFASSSSITVGGLPTDSSAIFVRLSYRENGNWKIAGDYTYTAAFIPPMMASITSPISGATLSGSSEVFTVEAFPAVMTNIRVGSTLGNNDIADRFIIAREGTSLSIHDLPVDGSTLYVRLQYRDLADFNWMFAADYTYTAYTAPGNVTPLFKSQMHK